MSVIIEAVPNISEGRDAGLLDELANAAASVPGASLQNHSADACHNRSVYTIIGAPGAVSDAVFALCRKAVERVDMRHHEGEHPCVGAADVVPFIPLQGAVMEDCVGLAEDFAARLSRELSVPCFLYAKAARRNNRQKLADIRRGGFGGLPAKLCDPLWEPDTGQPPPHPTAGVTAVGARDILIAFNINLACGNLALAKEIARSIRHSSGGLPGVQALGIPLPRRGLVQVSTNITSYRVTGVQTVLEAVAKAAASYGVAIHGTELIGAAPPDALPDNPERDLHLESFDHHGQILLFS